MEQTITQTTTTQTMSKEDLIENSKKFPEYRSRIDIDNQLGSLHNMAMMINNVKEDIKKEDKIEYEIISIDNAEIMYGYNVIEEELARRVRNFVQKITQCDKIKLSETNAPQDSVYNLLQLMTDSNMLRLSLQVSSDDPVIKRMLGSNKSLTDIAYNNSINGWMWEIYMKHLESRNCIMRLKPKTLNAFINSPIYELITVLEKKLYSTFDELKNMKKVCWVIQKIEKGYGIGQHVDYGRRYAFAYYLTPDNVDEMMGELIVEDDEIECIFPPVFNSIVMWKNEEDKMPLHRVNQVNEYYKGGERIALVGFFR